MVGGFFARSCNSRSRGLWRYVNSTYGQPMHAALYRQRPAFREVENHLVFKALPDTI
jgi:hypothetical protein